ncbi:hypothetical protein Tco_1277751 [Tanacetum coccineum]
MIHTPENDESDDEENVDEDEFKELYEDVNIKLTDPVHKEERKGDEEMIDASCDEGTQETSYEQVVDDAHVILTVAHVTQKTDDSKQSSFVSSDFANQFLILDHAPPSDHEVASMMNVTMNLEVPSTQITSLLSVPVMVIPDTSTAAATTVPPTTRVISSLLLQSTPTYAPTTESTTTLIPALPDFSSLFGFDHRVSTLEKELTRIGYATQTDLQSYTAEFEKKAQAERRTYIDLIEKSVKDIIKDEVKSQLSQILPKEVSDFATPMIQSTIAESLKNVILLDKMQKSKSYQTASAHRELYNGLINSYNFDKDIFSSYGKTYFLKRDREDEDKDEGPPAGSDQGLKKRKTSKDDEPSKGSNSKESRLSSSSKGTKPQPKLSGKSTQAE